MRARSLPLSGCTVATTRVADGLAWCESCARHVTDLSAMTEAEARAWLRDGPPGRRCISYRVDDRDRIQFAPSRAAILLGPWLALLLACAGHLDERDVDDAFGCRETLDCPAPADAWHVVPEEVASPGGEATDPPPQADDDGAVDDSPRPPDGLVGPSPLGPDVELDARFDPRVDARVADPRSTRRRISASRSLSHGTVQGFIIQRDHVITFIDVHRSPAAFAWPSSIEDPPTQAEALARAADRRAARRAARARR